MEINIATKALTALGHETRLTIFRKLVQAGKPGMSAGALAETLCIPNATLSFHLKELNGAELITARQESRFIFYSANFETMNALLKYLTENCCEGVACAPSEIYCNEERS